ncbi:MAG: YfcE family phosphodiesterase [Planctomycetota bacterium]
MLIGVISDSHDNLPMLERGLAELDDRGVEMILHAGDLVAPFALKVILRTGLPLTAVLGNNDGERAGLSRMHEDIHEGPHRFKVADRTVLMAHQREVVQEARVGGEDLLIYGHDHSPDIVAGSPMIVNPGEMGGWLNGRCTGAIVDLSKMTGELLEFGRQETPLT